MAQISNIEWTEKTWNPLTGCDKISPGCKNCYAERMTKRLKAMRSPNYENGFNLTCHPKALAIPYSWKKPCTVFVNSMSDLFHKDVPEEFIHKVFGTMALNKLHQFQVLTKRSERLLELSAALKWKQNIWMGVSVENQDYTRRIDDLRQTEAYVKFLSIEPLLGPIADIDLDGIDWVIVGGESGPKARPMEQTWVIDIKEKCLEANVPFFFKQWGGVHKKKTGRLLDGKLWNQMPTFPASEPALQPCF
ncbi:MAG: phage Gp37/Gp68 family protein [Desulfobacterales bacterium]|nr:phage Gp37/Gp68 family protein [Desulfobacterales bacterium]